MMAHKEESVQKQLNAAGVHIAVIPGELTCKLQPLDVWLSTNFLRCSSARNGTNGCVAEQTHTHQLDAKDMPLT